MFRNLDYYFPYYYPDFYEEEEIYLAMDDFLQEDEVYEQDVEDTDDESEQQDDAAADDEDEDGEDDDDVLVIESIPRVSQNDASSSLQGATVAITAAADVSNVVVEDRGEKRRRRGGNDDGDVSCSSNHRDVSEKEGDGEEWNRSEIDGLFCPICMESWTSEGEHQVCCLPCGHVYGMSCIKRWIQQSRSAGKCPQCNVKCKVKDIRKIYASRIVVVDEESQKRIRYLEAQCESLKKKDADFSKRETTWRNTVANLQLRLQELTEKTSSLEHILDESLARSSGAVSSFGVHQQQAGTGKKVVSTFCRQGSHSFVLQKELRMEGSRLFEIDACNHIVIIARKLSPMGGMHVITKMSLMSPHESEDILLSPSTKAVKDLRLSTSNSRLALIASLGKTLSVLSMETNNIILSYNLPVPAWSCSWDLNSSHYMYAGLQNGMLLVFDMRQTSGPVQSMSGLTTNPIHSIHSLSNNPTFASGDRSILTASSTGISHWSFGGTDERKFLIPETENQGVCISLAYCPRGDDIVATFRPRVENSFGIAISQPALTPVNGQGVHGSRVLYSRVGSNSYQSLGSAYATVDNIRLPKSTIMNLENEESVFVSGDELTHELVLQDLPSFSTIQRLKPHRQPIRDVKCAYAVNQRLVGCLSEDTLQLFRYNHYD